MDKRISAAFGLARQNNGPSRRVQKFDFNVVEITPEPCAGCIGCHHRQRFGLTGFALTQAEDGIRVVRIDSQMKSAQTFDGNDLALLDHLCGGYNGVVAVNEGALRVDESQLRTADGAGVGLRVKAPIGGIVVFVSAV